MTDIPTLEAPAQAHVHLIGGEKGGVGKSLVARLLAQYFIDHDLPFIGFDTDRSHGALLRFMQENAKVRIEIQGHVNGPTFKNKKEFIDAMAPVYEKYVNTPELKAFVERIRAVK